MNRLSRVTAILIHLQSKKIITAKELADRFEVSLRTIYRDIRTLQEAGVPIGAENGIGYFIVEGYSLPPIMITEEEANALIVSEKMIQNQGDSSLIKDFNSVLIKIKASLKNFEKDNLTRLTDRVGPLHKREVFESSCLSTVQKAISNATVLELSYHSIYKDEVTDRETEPLGLYYTDRAWIVIAYCRLRKEMREFRLDRIRSARLSSQTFEYRKDFEFAKYFSAWRQSS